MVGQTSFAQVSDLNSIRPAGHIPPMTKVSARAKNTTAKPNRRASAATPGVIEVPTPPQRPTNFTRAQMRKAVQSLMAQRA